jgi:hypothetical protein
MKTLSGILFSLVLILGVGFATHVNAQVAGCTTAGGYNTSTGVSCNGMTTIPLGCSSTAGFSSSTGAPCNGGTTVSNGYNGTVVGTNGYLNGCSSLGGYSATTGYPCNMAVNGVIYNGSAGTVNLGLPTGTTTTPSLPTTGAGAAALPTLLALIAAAVIAVIGARYTVRHSTN